MKYSFKEFLNGEIYESTRVMFVLGKYSFFNNSVCDTLKGICIDEEVSNPIVMDLGDEFGVSNETEEGYLSNSVDFNTFMEVIGVASINGKWFCKADLGALNKKQKETLGKYIKEPSPNGILVVVSNEWKDYKDWLKNRSLLYSKTCHIMQLSFPNRQVLKEIVSQEFGMRDTLIDNSGIDFFIMRMSSAYEDYPNVIDDICETHKIKLEEQANKASSTSTSTQNNKKKSKEDKEREIGETITSKDLKVYMKGIENFIVDDFVEELLKPMSSDKTNSKKVLKMMIALEDDLGPKELVYQVINKINEYIDLRVLINSGYIPIGVNYFFSEVINHMPDKSKEKYSKTNEWMFRRKVELASRTSLRDWEYMKIILMRAIENVKISDNELDVKCQKALYELATRSVITPDRINNIIGVDNVLNKQLREIDNIIFDEEALSKIIETENLANIS